MSVRIGFVLASTDDGAPSTSALTAEVIERVRAAGPRVEAILPDARVIEVEDERPSCDLYVLKSRTPAALALAGVLDARGADAVNSYRSSALARDKIASTALLAAARVQVPPSFATGTPATLATIADRGACWLKPVRGSRGAGVGRAATAAQWCALEPPLDAHGLALALFAQLDVPSGARDLKVYVVGEELWGVSRAFPARTPEEKIGAAAIVPHRIAAAARRAGAALGLEIYGVDVVGNGEHFWIVDVNAYPGFKGVAGAGEAIARYLVARARGLLAPAVVA